MATAVTIKAYTERDLESSSGEHKLYEDTKPTLHIFPLTGIFTVSAKNNITIKTPAGGNLELSLIEIEREGQIIASLLGHQPDIAEAEAAFILAAKGQEAYKSLTNTINRFKTPRR